MQITVNVSDAKVTADRSTTIVTYSLGSCIAVIAWDPVRKVAGMLHFQLPTSTMDPDRARTNPLMFADTGLNWLLEKMTLAGAESRRLKIKLAGGAKMLKDAAAFDIGKRNHTAIRKAMWQLGLFVEAEDCGGTTPRTVYLSNEDGSVTMKREGETIAL